MPAGQPSERTIRSEGGRRRGEVLRCAAMIDQIVGLALSILALCYLFYAMLKPEKF
jgi:K+-transporting ATPase KdpF subunit